MGRLSLCRGGFIGVLFGNKVYVCLAYHCFGNPLMNVMGFGTTMYLRIVFVVSTWIKLSKVI